MLKADIRREAGDGVGRYVLAFEGVEAELTYTVVSPGVIRVDHTSVPPAWRGQGIADRLTWRMAKDARAEGLRVIPRCRYVVAWRKRHGDWADVFAD